MADKKISQLTGATTPLAGTEVLPIVQSGSTVKVASDDLTVKNVRSNATTGILQITGPAAASTRVMTTPDANFTAARTDAGQTFTGTQTLTTTGNSIAVFNSTNANGGYVQIQKSGVATGFIGTGVELFSPAGSSTDLGIRAQDNLVFSAGGGTEGFRLNTSGNIVIKTAAKGIDFSANTGAAGETSSLLNWYETGTWTPVLSCATPGTLAVTYDVQKGYYTRVGRVVHIWGNIQTSAVTVGTATGAVRLTGLPFTSATAATAVETYMGSMGYQGINKAGYTDFNPQLQENTTYVLILASKSDGNAAANVAIGDLSAGTNLLYWQVTYVAA